MIKLNPDEAIPGTKEELPCGCVTWLQYVELAMEDDAAVVMLVKAFGIRSCSETCLTYQRILELSRAAGNKVEYRQTGRTSSSK